MEIPGAHFRHILLYYFQKTKNAVQARKKLYDIHGKKSFTERFRSGDFDNKGAPRSGCPSEVDDDKIKAMIENNRRSTTREIAKKLNISNTCVERHLKQLSYVNKLDIRVPHQLNEIKLNKRNSINDSLLKRNETDPFLMRIITGVKYEYETNDFSSCLKQIEVVGDILCNECQLCVYKKNPGKDANPCFEIKSEPEIEIAYEECVRIPIQPTVATQKHCKSHLVKMEFMKKI